ncbi:MAG: MoaD/ThiS family protein [Planctomycetota bacterium]|jgi:molybdopterin converting factor small subunit
MKIKVFGVLRKYTDGKKVVEVTVTSEKRVKDVIEMLNIPDQFVSLVESGGKAIGKDSIIDDGSEITLVPLVHGG